MSSVAAVRAAVRAERRRWFSAIRRERAKWESRGYGEGGWQDTEGAFRGWQALDELRKAMRR